MHTENRTVLIDINQVKKQTGFRSTQTIYNKMNQEGFPRPVSVGVRSKRWILSEVESWIQAKIKASRSV